MDKYGAVGQVTDDNIIQRMRISYSITKVTDTHSEYVTLILFSRLKRLPEGASVLRYSTLPVLLTSPLHGGVVWWSFQA